jgi:hypothetical protein
VTSDAPASAKLMYAAGALVLAGAVLWMGAMLADGIGLEERASAAVVTGKSYREAGKTYTQEIINNRSYTVAQERAELYALELLLNGRPVVGAVDRAMYEKVSAGDSMDVRYRRRRLTGRIDVVALTRR